MTKIAIATEDGVRISAHFVRASYFQVITIDDGKIVASERRQKGFHGGEHPNHDHQPGGHNHNSMIDVVSDCAVIIAGGMGTPAFNAIQSAGLTPILTDEQEINRAATAYASGTLVNRMERVHRH
jgi:predicted Fe-Mo cluster-binding NifX family protein